MEEKFDREDFLAKWAHNEISDAETEAFKKSKDYVYYKAILDGTELLEVPNFNRDIFYQKLQQKIANNKKPNVFIQKWVYAVAASIALLIGYFAFFNTTEKFETGFGQQLTVLLPDNSEVILNAKSILSYNKKSWENNERAVTLKGEAFFKVNKGSDFHVETSHANVSVLGTQFTVTSNNTIFEVICFEGKVGVNNDNLSKVLSKGQLLRKTNGSYEDGTINTTSPSWTMDESTFNNAPINQVIKALENQYKITFISNEIDQNLRFTGSFTHSNMTIALRSVFDSMEIKFTFINENTIDLVKE